jgi:hypothetical protein
MVMAIEDELLLLERASGSRKTPGQATHGTSRQRQGLICLPVQICLRETGKTRLPVPRPTDCCCGWWPFPSGSSRSGYPPTDSLIGPELLFGGSVQQAHRKLHARRQAAGETHLANGDHHRGPGIGSFQALVEKLRQGHTHRRLRHGDGVITGHIQAGGQGIDEVLRIALHRVGAHQRAVLTGGGVNAAWRQHHHAPDFQRSAGGDLAAGLSGCCRGCGGCHAPGQQCR